MTTHIISFLPTDSELLKAEISYSDKKPELHFLTVEESERESLLDVAVSVKKQIMEIDLKVGDEVNILVTDEQGVEEHICTSNIQKRFQETIEITIMRPAAVFQVPYIVGFYLGSKNRGKSNDVDHNYDYPDCGGNCSSCGS